LSDAGTEAEEPDGAETEASAGAQPIDRPKRYGALLAAILASFAVQGIAEPGKIAQVVVSVLLGATLLLALWAANVRPRFMRVALIIATLVVIASIVESANGNIDGSATRLADMLLVTLAPPAIAVGVVRSMRTRQRVTVTAVFGVLCLYILLGMFFAFTYGAIDHIEGDFFAQNVKATVAKCLYFSFTTLTTVGYGDLTARSNLGHTLSSGEALLGQIYLVTVVSVIVGNLGRVRPLRQR
jgi:Ion channel